MLGTNRLFALAAIVWLPISSIACAGWRLEALAPAEVIERHHPKALRVQRIDGTREVMYGPAIQNDTLWGRREPEARSRTRAIAITDVASVARLRLKPAETIVVSAVFVGVVAAFIALSTWDGPLGGRR